MRAMRVALPVLVRSVLPVLSRSSARAPSRLVSTEAAAEGSIAPKPIRAVVARSTNFIKEMTPTATFLGILVSLTSVGVLFYSRITKLEADMMGVAGKLEERVAGSEKTLKSDLLGIIKEVDAKNTGTKDAVDAKIIGFKEAADLKVRSRSAPDPRSRVHTLPTLSLTCLPLPPCSTRPSDGLVAVSVAVSVIVVKGSALAALVAVQKGKTLVQTHMRRRGRGIFACLCA
jgi:hypothetical protein